LETIKSGINRKEVIDFYIKYDYSKKSKKITPGELMEKLDYDNPDDIDDLFVKYGYKGGIIPGFKKWDLVKLNRDDSGECAIYGGLAENCFDTECQKLKKLKENPGFKSWEPPKDKEWYFRIKTGGNIEREEALILRPAVKNEDGAKWYLEDGSGRGLYLYKNALQNPANKVYAFAYLAKLLPDKKSKFMRNKFKELFPKNEL